MRGTFILIVAGFITKLLGFLNKVVVARIMGDEGVGLYMMAVPTFILIVTLTRLGLPVAISKLVAEAEAEGNRFKVKQVLVVALTITAVLSVIWTGGLFLAAPILSEHFFTDSRTIYPLLTVAPVVPVVAISSVIRGYFQGKQNMRPSAYSQVIEQIVRITLVALLTTALLPYGVEFAAAGAMFSVVLGEMASLLFLFFTFSWQKNISIRSGFFRSLMRGKDTFADLMRISLPTTGSQLIGSISYFFEPIIAAQSLAIAGVLPQIATKQYGALSGFAIPLLLLPTFITYAISTSLVPAISEAAAKRHNKTIEHRLNQAIRLALITGGISVVITYVFAYPLMDLLYNAPDFAIYVKVMAPFFFFHYFQGPLAAALQALGLAKAAMINSLIGAIVKTAAIFVLASNPSLGIMGVGLAISSGIVLVTLLHYATLAKATSFTINKRDFLRGMITMITSGLAALMLYRWFTTDELNFTAVTTAIMLSSLIYTGLAFVFGAIKKEDLTQVPMINKFFTK